MNDHVARMVNTWFERAQESDDPDRSLSSLVDAIHRMVREAENETRKRCEELATHVAGPELGGKIALAIRSTTRESLPRISLIDAFAPESVQS